MNKKKKRAMKRAETISLMLCTLISINVALVAVILGVDPFGAFAAGCALFFYFCCGCCTLVEAVFAGDDAKSYRQAGHRIQHPEVAVSEKKELQTPVYNVIIDEDGLCWPVPDDDTKGSIK